MTMELTSVVTAGCVDEAPAVLGAVDKAMVVLTAILTSETPPNLSRLCAKTGLAKGTVHRMLGMLRAHHMVLRFGDVYLPGDLLSDAERWVSPHLFDVLRSASSPYLTELHEVTGETASISLMAGADVHHLNWVYGHQAARGIGTDSLGSPVAFAEPAIRRVLRAYQVDTQPAGEADGAELSEVRRTGLARSDHGGLTGFAVPVNARIGQPPTALAVSGRMGRLDQFKTGKALRAAAFGLTRDLRRILGHQSSMTTRPA